MEEIRETVRELEAQGKLHHTPPPLSAEQRETMRKHECAARQACILLSTLLPRYITELGTLRVELSAPHAPHPVYPSPNRVKS